MDLSRIREDIVGAHCAVRTPYGVRRVIYADHVASGRALASLERQIMEILPMYANTHTEDSATGAYSTSLTHQAHAYVKSQLGADDTCKLVFCGSGSTAAISRLQDILGLRVAPQHRERVVKSLPATQRPVVLVGPYEHHSNDVSWRETIAEVIEIPLTADGTLDLAELARVAADLRSRERPVMGSFSAASNVTGLLTDTRSVARILHENDALAFFDFAASAPYVDIDMRPGQPDGYDAVFISPHKFLGGPGTPGLLCFQSHLYRDGAPTMAGGGTVAYVSSTRHAFVGDIETREDAGTPAILGKVRTALTFRVKADLGVRQMAERKGELLGAAMARLLAHPGVEVLGSPDQPRLAIISFLVRAPGGRYLHPRLVVRLLNDLFGIQARGGCSCAGPYGHQLLRIDEDTSQRYMRAIAAGAEALKPGWCRINLAPWITDDEAAHLVDAIEFIADHGVNFLQDYELDWTTGAWRHREEPAPPSLFQGVDALDVSEAPPPAEALELARRRAEQASPPVERAIPPQVPAELVYFAY